MEYHDIAKQLDESASRYRHALNEARDIAYTCGLETPIETIANSIMLDMRLQELEKKFTVCNELKLCRLTRIAEALETLDVTMENLDKTIEMRG